MSTATIEIDNTAPVGQAAMAASNPVVIASDQTAVPVSISGTPAITGTVAVSSLPATPAGANTIGTVNLGTISTAATAAAQTTGNASLSSIDGKAPALGQALAAASVPVVMTAIQVAQLAQETTQATGNTSLSSLVTANHVDLAAILAKQPTSPALESGGNLATLATNLPAKGQALAAASMPVVLTAIQIAQLAQTGQLPAALGSGGGVKVDGSGTALPVSLSTLPALVAGSAVIGHIIADSGSTTAVTSLPAIPTGSNTIGAVTAPGAAALALDATLTGGSQRSVAIGSAATGAAVSGSPVYVAGKDGSGNVAPVAVATHGGVVVEGVASGVAIPTSLAALPALTTGSATIGAVTGTSAAELAHDRTTAAAPLSVELSDGTAFYTGAKTGQLASSLGQQLTANSPSFAPARGTATIFASVPTAGLLLATGAGVGYAVQFDNNTGGAIFLMVFDATTTRTNGTQPLWKGATIATGASSTFQLGGNVAGLPFVNGLWLQFSSTQGTLTALASTAVVGAYNGS